MDFKKLGQQVGSLKKQAEDKIGDRAEAGNLKRDGKDLRKILAGDGSLAEKAKEAKEKVIDREKKDATEGSDDVAQTPPPDVAGKTGEKPSGPDQ